MWSDGRISTSLKSTAQRKAKSTSLNSVTNATGTALPLCRAKDNNAVQYCPASIYIPVVRQCYSPVPNIYTRERDNTPKHAAQVNEEEKC